MNNSKKSSDSWTKTILAYENSNLTKAEFCNKNNIPTNKFYYWCNKLRPDLKYDINIETSESSSFLPIKSSNFIENQEISIYFNNGTRVKFDKIPSSKWVADLISSMS